MRYAIGEHGTAEAAWRAIDLSHAVAEFEIDGSIASVNEGFCSLFGYSEGELLGRHHRLLCPPDVLASAQYAGFWSDLAKRRFHSGTSLRLGRGGNPLWIRASYSPVLGADGQPRRIVKVVCDVGRKAQLEKWLPELDSNQRPFD